jgi:fatty-acyl-CoA synthase
MFPGVHAVAAPGRPAIVMAGSGWTLTYAELDENSARLASALHQLGLREGDVIALLSDNAPEAFEVFWAALRSGLYVTAINWHLAAAEVEYILADSGARALFVSAGVWELAAAVATDVPAISARYAFGGHVDGYGSYAGLLAAAGPRLTNQPRGSEMLYSSGTTGRPKGIKPHRQPIQVDEPGDAVTALLQHAFKVTGDDVYRRPHRSTMRRR